MTSARIFAALLLVAATSCSATERPTSTSGEPSLPVRQHDIPLAGIDPCSLLTSDEIATLQMDAGTPAKSVGPTSQPGCTYISKSYPAEPLDSYTLVLDRTKGADLLLEFASNARLITVGGFPAVELSTDETPLDRHCQIGVDVADGQNLAIRYEYFGSTIAMTRTIACDKAHTAAEMAVHSLLQMTEG